jgi:hypothetical protein
MHRVDETSEHAAILLDAGQDPALGAAYGLARKDPGGNPGCSVDQPSLPAALRPSGSVVLRRHPPSSRRGQDVFRCYAYGWIGNADLVGALNLARNGGGPSSRSPHGGISIHVVRSRGNTPETQLGLVLRLSEKNRTPEVPAVRDRCLRPNACPGPPVRKTNRSYRDILNYALIALMVRHQGWNFPFDPGDQSLSLPTQE